MLQEPSPTSMKEFMDYLKHQDRHVHKAMGDVVMTTTEKMYQPYCSEGSTAVLPNNLLPIKKLTQLILISWSRWLLQSKLHRKEFRRKKA
jgi:hypothetical protein